MEVTLTLTLQPLHHSGIYTETKQALYHRIASLLAHLVFNFAMLPLDGKALPLMLIYGTMPLTTILWFQMESFPACGELQLHTEVFTTILQSGDVPMFCMYFIIEGRIINQIFNTQPC